MMILAMCCYGNDTSDGTFVLIKYINTVFLFLTIPTHASFFFLCVCVNCMIFDQIVPNMV